MLYSRLTVWPFGFGFWGSRFSVQVNSSGGFPYLLHLALLNCQARFNRGRPALLVLRYYSAQSGEKSACQNIGGESWAPVSLKSQCFPLHRISQEAIKTAVIL